MGGDIEVGRTARRLVTRDPEIVSGALVFAGTRVPVDTLIDYLKGGESIDDFCRGSRPSNAGRWKDSSISHPRQWII
jgi:hypothetical protein